MLIVSTKDFRDSQKKYFDMAKKEKVLIKRGNDYIRLVVSAHPDDNYALVSDKWINDFLNIPEKYRCNPFDISPSGDLFWADKRNVEKVKKGIEKARLEYNKGQCTTFDDSDAAIKHLESL